MKVEHTSAHLPAGGHGSPGLRPLGSAPPRLPTTAATSGVRAAGMLDALGHHVDAAGQALLRQLRERPELARKGHTPHARTCRRCTTATSRRRWCPSSTPLRVPGIAITTTAPPSALPRGEQLLKHPSSSVGASPLGRLRPAPLHGRDYDDNFYFNNPVDYMANLSDPGTSSSWPRTTSTGDGAALRDSRRATSSRGLWSGHRTPWTTGARRGHDWPYWKRQMNEYVSQLY